MIPHITPLTSDTPRLRQPVSRSPVARRHANTLYPNGTATSRTSCRHTVCPHTIEAVTRAFRTRLPPKVALRGCKTSVSFETCSKSHASSLQNERFVRDFLQKSHTSSLQNERFVRDFLQKLHVKSPKRAFRTRLPQKLTRQSLQNERFVRDFLQKRSTHITQPCQGVRDSSPSKQHPLTRQSQCDSDIHLYHNPQPHDSLRLPQIFPRPHV